MVACFVVVWAVSSLDNDVPLLMCFLGSERHDAAYRDWTITKLRLSPRESPSAALRSESVSRTVRRSIVSMTVCDQHLFVFFDEGDYVCLERNTLKDSIPSLIAIDDSPLVHPGVSTSGLTGSDEETVSSTDRVRSSIESLRAHPSDFTKIPTSEFLKMLQAQTHPAATTVETTSATPSLSGDTDSQWEEAQLALQATRKRKSPGDDGTLQRETSSLDQQELSEPLFPRNSRRSLDFSSGRTGAFLPPPDHVYHEFMGEPLIGYAFTHGMYACVALAVSGVIGYLRLVHTRHLLIENSVSALLRSFFWKVSMHADASDVLIDLLKVHEEIDDKPRFYQHLIKDIALICSRRNTRLHTYALDALLVLLR
jgi:hypothetical protein